MAFDRDLANTDDEGVRAALEHADVPALLPALAAALGDLTLIPDHLRPRTTAMLDPTWGLSDDERAEARALAFGALVRLRDTDAPQAAAPDVDTLRTLLEWAAGGAPIDDYLELLREELGIGDDLRQPQWSKDALAPERPFTVAIVGAGMSGLAAAHRCRQAGLDVVVLEKNSDVGGTWFENTYPGCRVDVSNLFYSYSFAQRDDWPEHYSSQQVLLDYFRGVADSNEIRSLVQFDTEVTSMAFDDHAATWAVQVRRADGTEEAIEAQAVISAVGQLNRPNLPAIAGVERFEGPAFHSARWDPSIDLTGKRVAVIGTGASAVQFIPRVADDAAHLTIFQRTPAWFIPSPQYTQRIGDEVGWLRRNVPGYTHWSRFWTFWRNVEGMMPMARVDEGWDGDERSVGAGNEMIREYLTGYLNQQFGDDPELLAKVVPQYPPFAKRFILDDGTWAATLRRDDVELVTEHISEVTPDGVHTADGEQHDADVIIYGTGFAASDFLTPMKVTGRQGRDLHETWGGDARAYLGITLPDFPNFFMLYGPNTNIVANGSIIYFSECGVHYILGCIKALLERDIAAIEPKVEVHDAYNERVDAENLRMAWGVSSVSSWYKNASGRTAQNWPFSLLEYWQQTREPNLDDFELL
ncbi:MAG: NAD(P)/FAD-dependent oxidoreductase [Acidimicrobiia bacterium]|nr:NAD(P)/FAD-dependent oxidoreductase [Acidimicrobiia bacterium]